MGHPHSESRSPVHHGDIFYCRLAANDDERKQMQMGSDDQIAWHTYACPPVEPCQAHRVVAFSQHAKRFASCEIQR